MQLQDVTEPFSKARVEQRTFTGTFGFHSGFYRLAQKSGAGIEDVPKAKTVVAEGFGVH